MINSLKKIDKTDSEVYFSSMIFNMKIICVFDSSFLC